MKAGKSGLKANQTRGPARLLLLVALLVFALPAEAWGCPSCREALAGTGRALGYAASILLLMSAPFLLGGFWTTLIIRLRRKANRLNNGCGVQD